VKKFIKAKQNYLITIGATFLITSLLFMMFVYPTERMQIIERAKGIAEAVKIIGKSIQNDNDLIAFKFLNDLDANK
jgi:hypothetical protein